MTYTIKSVVLENFLSHGSTELPLGRGVTVIVGENGAGKSSIVDAVYLALTGEARLRGQSQGALVRRGQQRARVAVTLEAPGRELVVTYEIDSRSSSKHAKLLVRGPGGTLVRAAGAREVPRAVAEELGLSPSNAREVVGHAIVLRQGGLQRLADLLASRREEEKAKLLGRLLGVEAYREAAERLADHAYVYQGVEVYARASVARSLAGQASRAEAEARRLEGEAARAERELARVRGDLARARDELAALAGAAERLAALKAEEEAVKSRLAELGERAGELRAEERRLRDEAGRLEPAAREAERLERLAALAGKARRALELESRVGALAGLAEEASQAARGLRAYLDSLPALEELGRLEGEAGRLEGERGELARREALLAERLEAARRALARLEEEARRAAGLLGVEPPGAGGAPALLERLEAEAARLEGEASRLEAEAAALEARAATARGRAREARDAAGLLRGGEARCPLCGSPLAPGAAEALRERLLSEAERLEAEAEGLEREARLARRRAAEARRRAEALRRAAASLRAALEAAPDPGEPGRLESELAEVRRRLEEVEERLSRVRGRLEALRAEAARAEAVLAESWRLAGRVAGQARRLGLEGAEALEAAVGARDARLALEALEALEARARGELDSAGAELAALEEELRAATGARGLREAAEAVLEAQARLAGAAAARERLRATLERLGRVREELEAVEEEAGRLRARLGEIQARIGELEREAAREEELRRRVSELEAEAARLEGQARAYREAAERARGEAGRLREAARRAEKLARLAELMRSVIPRALLRARLAELETLASEALAAFNTDYVAVSFNVEGDGSISVRLTTRTGETADPTGLSGGEKVAFALAVAMALARLSAVRAGFMILDEPTAGLDEERRRVLVDVLRRMGGGIPQLIVVTHDEEVRNAADVVYRVSKEAGVSVVSRETGPGV